MDRSWKKCYQATTNEMEQLHELLPKLGSVENGWRLVLDGFNLPILAKSIKHLIYLVSQQQEDIENLKRDIKELKKAD